MSPSLRLTVCGLFALLVAPSIAQNISVFDPTNFPIYQLSADAAQSFFFTDLLSTAEGGGADTSELLRIATKVIPGDESSVYPAFYPFAEEIHAMAESTDASIDPVGAREFYFHASTYYRSAAYLLIANVSDPRLVSIWKQQIAAFDKAIALLRPVPGESFTVRAENSSVGPYDVPAYFYKANASSEMRLPTVIAITGYDGSQQELLHAECIHALRRGMNCVTLEGPGQPTLRRFQGLPFIPDWWTAVTPVLDYVLNRTDVDPSKVYYLKLFISLSTLR